MSEDLARKALFAVIVQICSAPVRLFGIAISVCRPLCWIKTHSQRLMEVANLCKVILQRCCRKADLLQKNLIFRPFFPVQKSRGQFLQTFCGKTKQSNGAIQREPLPVVRRKSVLKFRSVGAVLPVMTLLTSKEEYEPTQRTQRAAGQSGEPSA